MNIGNLIASNIVTVTNNAELSQLLMSNPSYMQMLDDKQLAYNLVSNSLFFCGGQGDFEQFLINMLNNIIKQSSKGTTYTGYLPYTRQVFTSLPNASVFNKIFTEQAKMRMSLLYNWDVKDDKFNTLADASQCGIQTFEYLNRAVGVYFVKTQDKDSTKRTRTLITRNLELIAVLDRLHMIKWKEKQTLVDFQAKLWDKKQGDALFKEGKAWVIQMNCVRVISTPDGARLPIFELSYTKGRVSMVSENYKDEKTGAMITTGIIPLSAVYAEEVILKALLSTGVFKVVKMSNDGPHERLITSNPTIVQSLYKDVPADELQAKMATLYDMQNLSGNRPLNEKITTGFDIASLRHYFVDVESSINSRMVWGIQPGAWETITPVDISAVSTRCHNVDFYLLNQVFTSRVLNAKKADFSMLPAELKLGEYQFAKDKREAVFAYGAGLDNYQLFDFMTANQNFFGDLTAQLATRAKYRRHYLKNFRPIDLEKFKDKEPDVIAAELKKYLANGVVKLTIASQKTGRNEIMGTTNALVLAKEYGKNYMVKYGSPREKLKALKDILTNHDNAGLTQEIFVEYGLSEKLPENFVAMSKAQQISSIDAAILELQQKDLSIRPGTLYFKVADGYNITDENGKVSIFRQCNVVNILAASYSPIKAE